MNIQDCATILFQINSKLIVIEFLSKITGHIHKIFKSYNDYTVLMRQFLRNYISLENKNISSDNY